MKVVIRSWPSKMVVGVGRHKWSPDLAVGGGRRSWPSKVVAEVDHRRWSLDLINEASVVMRLSALLVDIVKNIGDI